MDYKTYSVALRIVVTLHDNLSFNLIESYNYIFDSIEAYSTPIGPIRTCRTFDESNSLKWSRRCVTTGYC